MPIPPDPPPTLWSDKRRLTDGSIGLVGQTECPSEVLGKCASEMSLGTPLGTPTCPNVSSCTSKRSRDRARAQTGTPAPAKEMNRHAGAPTGRVTVTVTVNNRHCQFVILDLSLSDRYANPRGCIRREGTSQVVPEAVRQAVGGGRQSGWGRLLSVTNAVEPGTCRQGDNGWA